MDTLEAIRTRRAVRAYDPAHRLSAAEQRELLELAMLSPTAFNLQHWRFVVVEDAELRRQPRAVHYRDATTGAPAALAPKRICSTSIGRKRRTVLYLSASSTG